MVDESNSVNNESDNSNISKGKYRSLRDIVEHVSGKSQSSSALQQDSGLAEVLPFPFLAIVGQLEMKYALLLALINPAIGGVLLIGPRGTGKTTAIRGLVDLLPEIPRSLCYYGCLPEDIEAGGIDAVCPNCARKFALGEPLAAMDKIRLVELPLNARIEDVVGAADENIEGIEKYRLHRGILAQADRNLLLVDEVNLLNDDVVDAILDAAAYGSYVVKRGSVSATFRARFVLIGSMNPEEGRLRPQIMDRFGLRVVVEGLSDSSQRFEAYTRVHEFQKNPHKLVHEFSEDTKIAQADIQTARDILPEVIVPEKISTIGMGLIRDLAIDSLRAEITLFEASRAYAALDGRLEVSEDDLRATAPMALRMRRSTYIEKFLSEQSAEDEEIKKVVGDTLKLSGE